MLRQIDPQLWLHIGIGNPKEIGVRKYKEMLMSIVKNALEILGYRSNLKLGLWLV